MLALYGEMSINGNRALTINKEQSRHKRMQSILKDEQSRHLHKLKKIQKKGIKHKSRQGRLNEPQNALK